MDVAVTKVSSKGQIVIPSHLRKDFVKGEELLIIKNKDQMVLHRLKDINKKFKEELAFAKETEKMLRKYERGEFKHKSAKEFLKELNKW
jgi:bifunctional DNA-binding transcriptional regulator/antitoxin component of YhaV-PrlF toxin-antitoxin module